MPEFFAEGADDDAESRYRALRDCLMSLFAPGSSVRFDGATRRAMAAAAPFGTTPATQQRVYDFCCRWGLINWTADDGATDDERRASPRGKPPAGTNAAAADALYRFEPAPANGAAAAGGAGGGGRGRGAPPPRGGGPPTGIALVSIILLPIGWLRRLVRAMQSPSERLLSWHDQ